MAPLVPREWDPDDQHGHLHASALHRDGLHRHAPDGRERYFVMGRRGRTGECHQHRRGGRRQGGDPVLGNRDAVEYGGPASRLDHRDRCRERGRRFTARPHGSGAMKPAVSGALILLLAGLSTWPVFTQSLSTSLRLRGESPRNPPPADAPPPADDFGGYRPQYQGFGVNTSAGRSGTLYRVNTLHDNSEAPVLQGDGSYYSSFRSAAEASGTRVIVFELSGYVLLTSNLNITEPYLTIAGQTAPSPGVTIRGSGAFPTETAFLVWTHDTVIQHLAIRPGDGTCNSGLVYYDGGSGLNLYNHIIDHVSISWFQDEGMTWADQAHDSTMWRSMVAEAMNGAPGSSGCTGGGSAWNGIGIGTGNNLALLQNLFAHNGTRNPQVDGSTNGPIQNNVIYATWTGILFQNFVSAPINWRVDGNYFKRDTQTFEQSAYAAVLSRDQPAGSEVYLNDNQIDNGSVGTPALDPWSQTTGIDPRVGSPPSSATIAGYDVKSSTDTYQFVLDRVGARPLDRDEVDTRIVQI